MNIARTAAWAKANPDKRRSWSRRWSRTPSGRKAALHHNWKRREKLHQAKVEGSERITADWFETVKTRQNNRCCYCSEVVPLTLEHIVPLARGGKHVRENIAAACKRCNSSKADKLISEWTPMTA